MRSDMQNFSLPPLSLRGRVTVQFIREVLRLSFPQVNRVGNPSEEKSRKLSGRTSRNDRLTTEREKWGSCLPRSERGITLIELLIVISVIAILLVALGFSFEGWIGKYRVESQVKEMYTDFMNARARAMERNRMHFVTGTNTTYSVYEDTNPGPDGNEALEIGSDTRLPTFPKTVQYPIDWTGTGTKIDFYTDGVIDIYPDSGQTSGSIFLTTTNDADYDCINISPTKIYMGKKNAATSNCDSK